MELCGDDGILYTYRYVAVIVRYRKDGGGKLWSVNTQLYGKPHYIGKILTVLSQSTKLFWNCYHEYVRFERKFIIELKLNLLKLKCHSG